MCTQIRLAEKALGKISYELTKEQQKEREHARSLFAVRDINKGEIFSKENVKSIRPGFGMPPKYYEDILGKKAKETIKKGTPMRWELVD